MSPLLACPDCKNEMKLTGDKLCCVNCENNRPIQSSAGISCPECFHPICVPAMLSAVTELQSELSGPNNSPDIAKDLEEAMNDLLSRLTSITDRKKGLLLAEEIVDCPCGVLYKPTLDQEVSRRFFALFSEESNELYEQIESWMRETELENKRSEDMSLSLSCENCGLVAKFSQDIGDCFSCGSEFYSLDARYVLPPRADAVGCIGNLLLALLKTSAGGAPSYQKGHKRPKFYKLEKIHKDRFLSLPDGGKRQCDPWFEEQKLAHPKSPKVSRRGKRSKN